MDGKVKILEEGNQPAGCANGVGKYECPLSRFQEKHSIEV